MNVLSLFDGISAGRLALQRAGINVSTYYRAEIDKYANQVALHHYPNDVQLGDVTKWREWDIDWASIDLISAGFPCQSWSVAGQQLGDRDARGMLFWTTLEIIKHVLSFNPNAKFLMENVKMKKDFEEYITHHTTQALGYVEKTLINSALVSAQNRNRYYWTNFEVTQPRDKGVLLKDVLEDLQGDRPCERIKEGDSGHIATATDIKGMDCIKRVYGQDGKAPTLTTMGGGHREPKVYMGAAIRGRYNSDGSTSQKLECNNQEKTNALTTVQKDNVVVFNDIKYRKLTPTECARLQTFPDGWAEAVVSKTQAYKAYGNAWTVDVIAHILKYLPRPSRLSYESCPKVKDSLIARRRACRAQTGGGNLMLTYYITERLKAAQGEDVTALLVAVADFNHTDIILLYDDEVAVLIETALQTHKRPVWLALYTNDEFFGDDDDE